MNNGGEKRPSFIVHYSFDISPPQMTPPLQNSTKVLGLFTQNSTKV
jgi:hypothetical protein